MEIFIEKQLLGVVYSLILGLIFGAVYDIIRLIHIVCKIASYSGGQKFSKKGVLPFFAFFLFDFIYAIVVTIAFSVFVYWTNRGDFRWFLAAGAALGFAVYIFTFGRVVMYFSEKLVRLIGWVIHYIVGVPVRFVFRLAKRAGKWIYSHTLGRIVDLATEQYCSHVNARYAKHIIKDLGLTKNIERERDHGRSS
ncbi:MAG: hypothetical protein E7627_04985 [Ruminococcaceae bacterium]|nr:hypothetical protein [Oscillospiraceae bacterium]